MSRGVDMSVRKRTWVRRGVTKEAWVVDFMDAAGKRRLKTFARKSDADRFAGVVRAVGSGAIPEPITRGYHPIEFTAPLPDNGLKNGAGREAIAQALRAAYQGVTPTIEPVVVHVIAEMPPRYVIADVDNLLKPALDALKGVAWMDDTQVCELLVRRIWGRKRQLHIKIWQIPGPVFFSHLNALAEVGLVRRPGYPNSAASAAASSTPSSPRGNRCP